MIPTQWLGLSPPRLRDDDKLHLAFVLSTALHLLVGSLLPGQRFDSRPQGDSALQVSFRRASPPAIENQRSATSPNGPVVEQLAVLTARSPAPLRLTVAAPPARTHDVPKTLPATAAPVVRPEAIQAVEPVPERLGKPGEVQVVLLINENSRAEQILWGKLPALNDRQLQRIEAHLRSRPYPGRNGQTIAETVDVLAFLRSEVSEAASSSNQ